MTLRTRSRKIVKKRVRLGLSPAYRQAGARSALFFALFMPMITHAAVQITEVMYDPPGANAGGQWLEVTNVDSVAISIAGYKITEGTTNHKISVVNGTSTLGAGESAIVTSDPQIFLTQFPKYASTLFKSAISLPSKKGETIALKDAKPRVVDSISYDPSAGASGDGNTLHREGSVLVVGAPNPGSTAHTEPLQIKETSSASATTAATSASTKATTKTTKNYTPTKTTTYAAGDTKYSSGGEGAATPLLSQIHLPQGTAAWVLAAVGLFLLGISAVWYLWQRTWGRGSNLLGSEAFTIEE